MSSPPPTPQKTHLGVRHAVAVWALDVEANPGPFALVDGVLVLHVLHEVPSPLPVPVVVPPVHLQWRPEVVGGLFVATRGVWVCVPQSCGLSKERMRGGGRAEGGGGVGGNSDEKEKAVACCLRYTYVK